MRDTWWARKWLKFSLLAAFIFAGMAGNADAYISGTVAPFSGKTGRIYLSVQWSGGGDTGFGVSIAAPGSFQINGVPSGTYTVKAFMDTQGAVNQHANDPVGTSGQFSVSSGSGSAGTITLTNPSPVGVQAPQVMVFRGSGGNFVLFDGPQDNNGLPIADKYTISWSTSPSGSPVAGSKVVASGDKDFFAHSGGTASLYYQVTAVVGATNASSAWTPVPAASGSGSVTGKVYFPGVSATGPLFVALVDESTDPPKFSVLAVATPATGGSYTISNVPAGTYGVHLFLDMNNSGTFDAGDVGDLDNDFDPTITVSSSPVTAPDMTLTAANTTTRLTTQHSKGDSNEWYNVNLRVAPMKKQPVNVQITSGPQITTPVDVAFGTWGSSNFQVSFNVGRPTVGDTYQVKVTYSDSTFETIPAAVTAVLDGFATPQAPVGFIPYSATPTFTWTAPSPAPSQYIYSIWVNESNSYGGSIWDAWGIPSSTTSLTYGSQGDVSQQTLTDGTTYNWTVTVKDSNGNEAQNQVSFTPTTSPGINGFSPIGGLAGTTVTITGVNFNPNPASNTVLFNGVTASVTAASSTSLTVTVPQGASTGKIQVNSAVSAKDFTVAAPINISGVIQTSASVAIAGARVEKSDDPTIYTTTAANGSFTLNSLFPDQWVELKISKSGYVPTYTKFYLQGNLDLTPYPSHLYTQAELTSWGVTSGKGAIIGQVVNTSTTPYSVVGGVVVTAQSQNSGLFYPVTYYSGVSLGGTSTYGNGIFFVPNVNDNDWVNVNANKSSWNFQYSNFAVHANSVTEGGVFGSAQYPSISGFTPASGKAGTSVIISGNNFSSILAENTVTFNGTTATVTAASSTSLTVTVPAGATTGTISVTTAGGSSGSSSNFTVKYTLTATIAGTGGGTVYITPPDPAISFTSGTRTQDYDYNTPVTLTAAPDASSQLSWSGCATASGNTCTVTLSTNKSVTATFTRLNWARILRTLDEYSLLRDAYAATQNGDTIQVKTAVLTENFNLDLPVSLILKGGYDSTYFSVSGVTTLDGVLTISQGALTVDNLAIK